MSTKVAEVPLRTQMNLVGNGDGTIAKLGEALTGVSINKPLIKKKEAERGSTGAEYQWHPHICMQAQLSRKGTGLTGASPVERSPSSIPDPAWWRESPNPRVILSPLSLQLTPSFLLFPPLPLLTPSPLFSAPLPLLSHPLLPSSLAPSPFLSSPLPLPSSLLFLSGCTVP